jgi:hypothetical protein
MFNFSSFDAQRASIAGIIEATCNVAKSNESTPTIDDAHRNVQCSERLPSTKYWQSAVTQMPMTPATSRAKTGRSVQPAHNGECSILNAGSMPLKSPWTYVNIWLEQLAHTARKAAETVYRREFGLDTFQIRILRVVYTKTLQPVSEIAKITNLDRTFVSRMISRLVRAGLLERTIAEDDARKIPA